MTRYPDLFAALAAPFDKSEVKILPKGNKPQYITARSAMNRLDSVLGPENWWDAFIPSEHSVQCQLTIRLPDGSTVTKADAGGYAGMADQGDDDKSGYSDAFKRAAAKFGVARYLYRDGVPSYEAAEAPEAPQRPARAPAAANGQADPEARDAAQQWLRQEVTAANRRWRAGGGEHELVATPEQALNALVTAALGVKLFRVEAVAKPGKPDVRSPARCWAALGWLRQHHDEWLRAALMVYFDRKRQEARRDMAPEDESQDAGPEPEEESQEAAAPPAQTHESKVPRTGRALYAWAKAEGERLNLDLLKYLNAWAKLQGYPARMIDWDAERVACAYAEADRKLQMAHSSREEVREEALLN